MSTLTRMTVLSAAACVLAAGSAQAGTIALSSSTSPSGLSVEVEYEGLPDEGVGYLVLCFDSTRDEEPAGVASVSLDGTAVASVLARPKTCSAVAVKVDARMPSPILCVSVGSSASSAPLLPKAISRSPEPYPAGDLAHERRLGAPRQLDGYGLEGQVIGCESASF